MLDNNMFNTILNIKLSEEPINKSMLDKIINQFLLKLNNANNLFNKTPNNYLIEKYDMKKSFGSSDYFPINIKNEIIKNYSSSILYTFKINKRDFKIIFISKNNMEYDMEYYSYMIRYVYMWLYIISNYTDTECVKTLTIKIFMTDLKKRLPDKKNEVIGVDNVNSGYSDMCQDNGSIVIYRKEEWFKVLIHESFHNFGLDINNYNKDEVNKRLKGLYKLDIDYNIYETYTEFWAEVINCIFISYSMLEDNNDKISFLLYFETLMYIEKFFSFLQVNKILRWNKLKYDDFKNSKPIVYKQNSNVFEYYILKLVLINNYKNFILWCDVNNNGLFNFKNTDKNLNGILNFIQNNYNSSALIQNLVRTKDIKDFNLKNARTLRMTLTELEH